MLRLASPRIGHSLFYRTSVFRRSLHNVPVLRFDSFKDGVPGLLSPAGFEIAWTQYQALMIEKLNMLTAGTEMASDKPRDILVRFAREPSSAALFNYASMAHNNHFFFNTLSPSSKPIPDALRKQLEASFSSIETLRLEFIQTAAAMFGPGFVWMVRRPRGEYSLVTTYLAGSPYPAAHYRRQPVDMNTEDQTIPENVRRVQRGPPVNSVGTHSRAQERAPGAAEISPVLCLNTWEHVYLPDYGVGGKKAFAEAWWQTIDWDQVALNAENQNRSFVH